MRYSLAAILSLAASSMAIQVLSPTTGTVWGSASGPQTVSWTSVSSDPTSIKIVLVSSDQLTQDTLVAQQATGTGQVSITVAPPSGGWPTGVNWTINIENATGNGILAQSGQLDIVAGSGTTTGSLATGTANSIVPSTVSGLVKTTSTPVVVVTQAGAQATDSASSQTNLNPTGTSAGVSAFQISSGLLAAVAAVHAFLL